MAEQPAPRGGPLMAAKAVFWSFFGVRKRADWESDTAKLKPAQLIVAGLIGGAFFLATVLGLVYLVTHLAGVK